MQIKERVNKVELYLSVESQYENPVEGKGKQDAVLFEMGRLGIGIDSCVAVPVDVARSFAEAILKTCKEIEGNT